MCDPPGSGMETMSPTLASGFLTTEPPGETLTLAFIMSTSLTKFALETCHVQREQNIPLEVDVDQFLPVP